MIEVEVDTISPASTANPRYYVDSRIYGDNEHFWVVIDRLARCEDQAAPDCSVLYSEIIYSDAKQRAQLACKNFNAREPHRSAMTAACEVW